MKVTLINYTQDAEELLIFTKNTRLSMTAINFEQVSRLNLKTDDELNYIANTIQSSWEFIDYVFMVEGVSRAYTHQQVRTRAASYAQQSMRVSNMGDFDYIYSNKILQDERAFHSVNFVLAKIKEGYNELIAMGIPPEDARGILPTNISTNIVCKFNLRTFSELVKSRSGGRTQTEYQNVIKLMTDEVLEVHPWAEKFIFNQKRDYYDDIESFAEREYGDDLIKKGELLKIVDKMRKEK